MTDTCERLATKAIGSNRCQVVKRLQLGRGKAFAEQRQIISLRESESVPGSRDTLSAVRLKGDGCTTHVDAVAVVRDL